MYIKGGDNGDLTFNFECNVGSYTEEIEMKGKEL
jgi:hypothetical protein